MDGKTLRAELRKVIKLNEELSRANAKLTSDLESLVDATQALQEDRDRRVKEQRICVSASRNSKRSTSS